MITKRTSKTGHRFRSECNIQ